MVRSESTMLETSSNDNMVNVERGEDINPKKHQLANDGNDDSNKRKKTNESLAAVLATTLAASTTVVVIDAFVVPRQAIPFTTTSTTNSTSTELDAKKRVVVIGNGMVGQRFMEKILEDTDPEDVQLSTYSVKNQEGWNCHHLWYQFEIVWLCTRYQYCIFEN